MKGTTIALIAIAPIALLLLLGLGLDRAEASDEAENRRRNSVVCPYCNRNIYEPELQTHIQLVHPTYATYPNYTYDGQSVIKNDAFILHSGETFTVTTDISDGHWAYSFNTPPYSKDPKIIFVGETHLANPPICVYEFKPSNSGYTVLTMTRPAAGGNESFEIILAVNGYGGLL